MSDARPDPDALLAQVQRDEAAARRGRLKIFFGANAGVGKTFAMLAAAHAAQQQGRAVRIGVVETHRRADTEAIGRGLAARWRQRDQLEQDLVARRTRGGPWFQVRTGRHRRANDRADRHRRRRDLERRCGPPVEECRGERDRPPGAG